MKIRHKFRLRKANIGYYVDCVFLYRELAAIYCLLYKCKLNLSVDHDIIDPILNHIDSLLNDVDNA